MIYIIEATLLVVSVAVVISDLIVTSRALFTPHRRQLSISDGDPRSLPHPDEDWRDFFNAVKVNYTLIVADDQLWCDC